jgi:O-antigen/teichoic acid export membrane protein
MKQQTRRAVASPTLRTITGLAGSNSLALAVGVVGSLVQARFVTPEDLGYFRSFAIVTGYVFFLQLGLFGVLARFYPYYIGKGQPERGVAIAEICQAWILTITLLVGGVFLFLTLQALAVGNWRACLGWLVQVFAVTGIFYGGYLGATFRSGHDFKSVARGSLISSAVSLLALPLFVITPYFALAVRSSAGSITNLIFLHLKRPLRLGWRFRWREWLDLIKISLPMFVADYGNTVGWMVVESTLILRFLGTQALGLWSMSFTLVVVANSIPQAITAVYNPRVIEAFGRTEDLRHSLNLCRKPLVLATPIMLVVSIMGALLLPIVVPILMPNYIEAIPVMTLMLLTLPLVVLELPHALLIAMGKTVQQNAATYMGMGSFILLALIALRLGAGLNAIVAASLVGRVVRLAFIYTFVGASGRENRQKCGTE